ncbi:MAG: hypothetical protein F4205_17175 [Gemmatimonadetes bacterium]|nr:hypothetical protein [Gemmatimonadota bacterium]MXX72271.1 hypothetical protein [Gemmatimonadota bacterium]MYC93019.1 hypothetical protein [Gemmatimonadota bacterium]MYG37208.1 hypothetical protein [Gemmatimonadota bacterium]
MIARSRITPLLSLLVLAGVSACGGGDDGPSTPQEPPRPATITIEPASATLTYISQTTTFNATIRDQYGAAMAATVTWSSSDEGVFTVDGSGQVTAAGNGAGTLTASAGGLNATASVTVEQRPAAIRVVSGDNQEALRGTMLPEPVVVRLEDRGGHGVAGVEIGFAPGAESGSVSVESVTSDDSGQGTTEWTLGSKFGAQTLIISVPGGIQNRARARATSDTPLPDLSVETVTLSRNDPTDLETLDITATLANKGDAASPDTFMVHLTLDGIAQDSVKVAQLQPEGRTTLEFTAGPFEAGNRRLAVVIDPERGIDEWEKENNTGTENLTVAHQEIIRVGHTSNISATLDEVLLFRIDVEEGSREALNVEVGAASGQDPDLFVNYGFRPDHHYKYSCISGEQPGDRELCQLLPARTGSYHVAVHAYSTFRSLELKISVGGIEVESYDIDVVFIEHGSAEQDNVVLEAARRWESVIVQGVTDIDLANNPIGAGQCATGSPIVDDVIDDVRMFVRIDSIDGPGKILARAGPCFSRITRFEGYPDIPRSVIAGAMEFDEDDLNRLAAQGILVSTVLHEMGHVLGFGTMWDRFDLLENHSVGGNPNADTHFTGPLATRAFERSGGRNYRGGAIVPVENGGTRGSADSHWRESVFENELMTPFLSAGIEPFSIVTIEAMADLGFSVDPSVADSYRIANTSGAGRHVDPESMIDLSNDIADYPIVFIDQKGRRVDVVRRR